MSFFIDYVLNTLLCKTMVCFTLFFTIICRINFMFNNFFGLQFTDYITATDRLVSSIPAIDEENEMRKTTGRTHYTRRERREDMHKG